MQILKFRIMYEEDENIFRDIEIKPSQTFTEFESVINSSFSFPPSNDGLFFQSNDQWQRVKQLNANGVDEAKGKSKARAKAAPTPMIVAFIDDPHQKFIYEYKNGQEFSFLLELVGFTGTEKMDNVYPVCVKQQGPSPFKKEDMSVHYSRVGDDTDNEDTEEVVDEDEEELDALGAEVGNSDETEKEEESSEPDDESFSDDQFEQEFGNEAEEENTR